MASRQTVCPKCNIPVSNFRRHLERNRCKALIQRRQERLGDPIKRKDRGKLRKNQGDKNGNSNK